MRHLCISNFYPTIQVISLADGKIVSSLLGHYAVVNCCAYRAPYQELYSGGYDNAVLCWQPEMDQHSDYRKEQPQSKHRENWSDSE